MAESLSGSPIGSAPVSEFERLLQKTTSEFDRLLQRPLNKPSRPQTEFEALLDKDFKPSIATTVKPKFKFRAKLAGGLKAAGGGSGDDLVGLLMVGAELWNWSEQLKERRAIDMGFKDDAEFSAAKEDVQIASEFASIATEVLTQTKSMLEWKKRKRRQKPKRTVIYGWSRK